jgi:hypothetical protein
VDWLQILDFILCCLYCVLLSDLMVVCCKWLLCKSCNSLWHISYLVLQRTSQEYRDACELWDLFISTKTRLLEDQRSGEETGQEHKGKIILKVGKLVSDKLC